MVVTSHYILSIPIKNTMISYHPMFPSYITWYHGQKLATAFPEKATVEKLRGQRGHKVWV